MAASAITIAPSNNPYGTFAFGQPSTVVTTENAGVVQVSIVRSAGVLGTIVLSLSVSGNASAQVFSLSSNTVTFLPGQTIATFSVNIANDNVPQLLQSIVLTLASASPAAVPNGLPIVLSGTPAVINISPSNNVFGSFSMLALANNTVAPGPDPLVYLTVQRAIGSAGSVRVVFGVPTVLNNLSAVPGRDYVFVVGGQRLAVSTSYLYFAPGQTRFSLVVGVDFIYYLFFFVIFGYLGGPRGACMSVAKK